MKKLTISLMSVLIMSMCLMGVSCGSGSSTPTSLKDGTYTGRSSDFDDDESGNGAGYGEVEITVSDNAITECKFNLYELDGTIKDENYGADLSQENRLKAQKAVQSADKYASALVEKGSVDEVDSITGATISYNEFQEAVADALSKAAE